MDNSSLSSTHKEILSEPAENTCARVAGFMHWVPELFWLRLTIWFTLLCFLGQPVVTLANIIAAPTTPLTTVNTTAQGRELVNINTPNQNGVSFNQYQQFDVNKNGAVLNNNNGGPQANQNVALQQGSFANGNFVADRAAANPNLGQRHAKLILNQVTSTNPSQLNGPLEVAGQKADVIIANPNGITCNGCGFINTTRGVLTTGQLNDNGGTGWGAGGNSQLSNIAVAQGKITVASGGLVDYQTPQIDIIARGISIQGQIEGRQGGRAGLGDGTAVAVNKLNLIAGENTVRLTGPTGQMGINNITTTQPYSNTNPNQDLEIINTSANTVTDYIDLGRLGGMYAYSIFLASTTKGVGVNSAGTIYSINDVEIAANGQVHLGRAGTNPDGSTGYGSVESGYYTDINRTNTNDPRGNGSITIVGATGTTQTADGRYAADAVDNANGTLRAHGGDILIRAASFDNTAGTVAAVGGNDLTGTAIGGAIDIMTNGLVINQQGSLQANSDTLTIEALGIDNTRGGIIYTASDMSLSVGTAGINNSAVNNNPAGLINADRKIELNTTGTILNSGGGTLQAKQNVLNATANNIDNTNGGIFKSGTDIRLTAMVGDIDNRQGGLINAGNGSNGGGGYIQLYAKQGWLRNSNAGQIKSDKDYVSITAVAVDNSARGVLRALQDINITAQQGDIDNHLGGIIDASGQVRLTAAQGAILNAAGSVQSRQGLTIQSQRIDNAAGLLQDIDKGNLDITTGVLNNLAGNYTAADGSVSVGGKISSQTGTITNLTATDLINSGVINSGNTDPYASPASITISGNFTNSGLIQGRQDLTINFQQSPSQVNSGTFASGRDLIIKNASYFTNLGQADSSGRCGGLCAGNDLILTGGQVINNGMMRALGSIYLGFDPTDSTANTAGLSRLQNLLGAAIIAVQGSIKARVNGADFAPGANGQGVDPVALQTAQTALTNAQAAQTTANAALQNSQALVGNLNTLATTADNLNDIQGGSLTAVLERGKYDSLQLQTTATSLSSEATNTLLNNSNLSTGAISAANSADTTAKEIYTQTGTTMVETDTDAQGNPIMSSIAVGTGKVTDAETALSDARSFFGWGDNALTDVVAPENPAANAPVPKLSDYITNLTNLKNNTNGANNTGLYQAAGCAVGATATCDQKLQTLIDSLQALQVATQNVTTQINSGTTTVAQLINAGTTDIATKQTTADAAALTTAQAQATVIAITGPVANSQALQNAQNDVNAKQAAVDQINNNNSSLVQQAAADQAALAVANANQIDAAKALTNAQNLQKDLDVLSTTAGGLAAINGAGSITDSALAVQSQASLMLQASNRIALAASDPSLTDTILKSAVTALANSANQNASTSSAAANALLARLDHSFALADQTPVNNLNETNQNANTLVASINTRLQSLTDYIKTVQGQPQAGALETVASKLVALRNAAGALASSASNPVSPAASSSTPADPPLTATQRASATQHAVDGLQAAAQEVNTSLSTLSAFTANDPANIGALLTDSSNFVNTAQTDANNSNQAKLTLVRAIDTQFRADSVNQTLTQQMFSANQAAAVNQTTANNLNASAASQINLKQIANAQAITIQVAAQITANNSAAQVDAIQNQLIAANNDLVNSIVAMSKVAGASALVSGQPAIHNIGTIYAGQDITLALNPKQGEKATIFNESHQDAAGNQDGGLIQAGRSISLGRDCGLDSNGLCTQTLWNNTNGGSAGIVEVNNTAAIRTTGVDNNGVFWSGGGDINIQAEIFHNSIVDPGVSNNEGPHTRVYQADSGRYIFSDPLTHAGIHNGYVMGVTPSGNNSVDIQNAVANTAAYITGISIATAALTAATAACAASLGIKCFAIPIAAAALVAVQMAFTGAFYRDFTETWTTTQSFNTPLSKARPNITAARNLSIRGLNGTNIGGTLAAGNNVTISPIDGVAGKGTFINKALVLQQFDYTLYGRTQSKCIPGDTLCTGRPIQTLGDVLDPLGAPVTTTLVLDGIQQSYGGIIQALNGTAGITVGTLINIGPTDPDGNAPDTGIAGLSITSSTQGPAVLVGTRESAAIDIGHGAISQVARGGFFANFSLPSGNNGLFIRAPANSPYLVVTNPLYGSNNNAPGADILYRDYYKPSSNSYFYQLKVIGDARYQAKLVQDQLLAATGLASLGSSVYGPDILAEMTMKSFAENDALRQQGKAGFTVGEALTPEQQAELTQDIIWLVSQNISGQMVLVPQLYLSSATKAKIAGGQILGKNVDIDVARLYNIGGKILTNDMAGTTTAQSDNTRDNTAPGKLTINASNNILNASGTISGNELNIKADTLTNTTLIKRAGDQNNYQDIASSTGLIQGGQGGATITTTNDLNNFGAQINAQGGDINVTSTQGNINVRSLVLEQKETKTSASGNLFNHSEHLDIKTTQTALTGSITATQARDGTGGNVNLSGQTGINLTGAAIKGDADVTLLSEAGSINDRALYLTNTRFTKDSSTGFLANTSPSSFSLSYGTDSQTKETRDKIGSATTIQAGNGITIKAQNIISEGGVYSGQVGDIKTNDLGVIAFKAIKNEHYEKTSISSNRISISGSVAGATGAADSTKSAIPDEVASLKAGFQQKESTSTINQTTYENALLAFKEGITIQASHTDNKNNLASDTAAGAGQSVLDLGGLDIYSGGDVNAQADRVITTKYVNSYSQTDTSNEVFVGVDANLHSSLMTTIKDAQAPILEPTKSEIAKYKAMNPGKTDDDAVQAIKAEYAKQKEGKLIGDAVSNVVKGLGGVKAGFGVQGSSSTSTVTATSENISHISGANINITANRGNMTLAGVDLSATGQTYQKDTGNQFIDSQGNPQKGYQRDAEGNIVNAQGRLVSDKNGYLLDASGNRLLQGGNINLQATQGDIDIIAARTTLNTSSSSTSYGVNLGVGLDVGIVDALMLGNLLAGIGKVGFSVGNDSAQSNSVNHIDSSLAASGTLTINSSQRNVNLTGVTAIGSDVNILAGGDINSNAYQDSQSYSSSSAYVGFSNSLAGGPPTGIKGSDKSGNSTQQVGNTIYALGSNTTNTQNQLRHVDGTLNLLAKSGNITMIGGDYYGDNANLNASQGDIKFIAAKRTAQEESSSGGVQLSMGASASFAGFGASADYGTLDGASASYTVPDALQDQVKNYSSTTSRSSGAANAVDADTRKPQPQTESQAKKMAALQAAGFTSQLDPNDDSVTLANNIFTSGSQNISDTLRNQARMTQSDTSSVSGSASEKTNSGELISAKVGVGIDMAFEKSDATEYTNAQLNVGKKLTVSAGKGSVDIGGIDIGNIDPSGQAHSGTEINISAEEIKSTKYVNTYSNESHSNSTFIGLKAEGHSAIADAAANVATHIVNAVKEKNYKGKDGGGLSASDYAKGRFAAQATIQAVNDAMNLVTGDLIGGSVTMNVGNEHTWKKSNATQENINTITGGNINLQSTRGDITLNGVNISAEDQVILDSARDINVRAAQSTSSEESNTTSVNLSRGAGIGVNAVALATKGDIGPNASVGLSASNTYSRSNTTSYENSSISAGNQVILKSKGDTNLIGANVDSKNVDLDIGGNLNIVSLQDTKVSQSIDVNANVGGGASFSAYTIASPTVSLGGGGGEHHDNYAIVKKQAGIRATEGVSGNVAGDITLTGAYIENQSGQSTLGVGGDVYATQLKDFRDKDGGTGGVNVTIGQNSQKTGKSVQGLGYNFTTDEAIHYEAIQNATIAGVTLQKTWTSTDANGKAVINEDTTNAIKGLENVNTDANNKTVVTRDDYVQGFATGADPLDFLNSLSDIWEYKQKQKKKQPANDDDAPSSPTKKPSAEDPDIDVTPNPAKVPLPVKEPGVEQAPPDSPQPTSESLPDTRPSEPATPAANDATSNNTTVLTTLPPRDTILPSQEKPYVAPKVESETVIPKATTDRGDSFYQEMSTTTANSRFMIDPSDQTLLNSLKNNPNVTQITGSDGSILYTNYDKVVSGIAANDSVFWSNASRSQGDLDAAGNPLSMMAGQDVARQYGANHNGTSLEMAIDKSGIKMPNILDIAPPYAPLLKQIQEQNLQPGTAEYRNAVKDAFKNNKNDPEYQKAANDPNYKAAKDSAYKAWDDISAALARNAKGEVRALLSPDIVQKVTDPNRKPAANDSIFVKTEYDALKNNPNVTKIIAIDPKTYQEIILFDRTQMATPGSKPATETTQPIKDQSVNK